MEQWKCAVHLDKVDLDQARMLRCGHVVCVGCLLELTTEALQSAEAFMVFKCPYPACEGEIDKFMVLGNFPDLFPAYSQLKASKALLKAKKSGEFLLYCISSICPTANCTWRSLAKASSKRITCFSCDQSYCPSCRLPPHEALSCIQARAQSKGTRPLT